MVLCNLEISKNLAEQERFSSRQVMLELGFTSKQLEHFSRRVPHLKRDLKKLAEELNWKIDSRRTDRPSANSLAQLVGMKPTYDFLYHATSRSVHFTPTELMRRVWGQQDSLSVNSNFFEPYWASFSLYWGLRIYLDTLIEILEILPETERSDMSEEAIVKWSKGICSIRQGGGSQGVAKMHIKRAKAARI